MADTPCIEWAGRKNKAGYGVFSKGRRNGRDVTGLAHRHVWELKHGPLSRGLQILHRCDNPSCVNPDHLRVGDQLDNMHDMIAKGRANWRGGKAVRPHPQTIKERAIADPRTATDLAPVIGVSVHTICRWRRAAGRGNNPRSQT